MLGSADPLLLEDVALDELLLDDVALDELLLDDVALDELLLDDVALDEAVLEEVLLEEVLLEEVLLEEVALELVDVELVAEAEEEALPVVDTEPLPVEPELEAVLLLAAVLPVVAELLGAPELPPDPELLADVELLSRPPEELAELASLVLDCVPETDELALEVVGDPLLDEPVVPLPVDCVAVPEAPEPTVEKMPCSPVVLAPLLPEPVLPVEEPHPAAITTPRPTRTTRRIEAPTTKGNFTPRVCDCRAAEPPPVRPKGDPFLDGGATSPPSSLSSSAPWLAISR